MTIIGLQGGKLSMTREEALAILKKTRGRKRSHSYSGSKFHEIRPIDASPDPPVPSGMTPTYLKENHSIRKKKPNRKKGNPGSSRKKPEVITDYCEHTLNHCPHCRNGLRKPVRRYKRVIEGLPASRPSVTEHRIYRDWCGHCSKIVIKPVTEALPNSNLGLRLVVYTAWLH